MSARPDAVPVDESLPIHTSAEERRLARMYSYLYPAWKTVLFSWSASVLITVVVIWAIGGEAVTYSIGLIIASVCSISISWFVSRIGYTYQTIISEKNEALLHYAADLSHVNGELESFARTVAHDLRSPVANMIGLSAFLQDNWTTVDPAVVQDMIGKIRDQGDRSLGVIASILLLAQVRHGEVECTPLNMQEITGNALARITDLVTEKNAVVEAPEHWPEAIGYGPWIEEIWVNYISNALKYGGTPPQVTLGATERDDGVQFWVQDNGDGLSEEQQARLFTEFTRLHTDREAEGHGIGLSLVRRIGDRLNGQVGLESAIGTGSRFYFTLPR